jgi:ectoine hydroxylase-related dioxygenase (phytanoyl-CoA dioxygenase family)
MAVTVSPAATAEELARLRDRGYFVRHALFSPAEMDAFERDADEAVHRGRASGGISKEGKIDFVHSGTHAENANPALLAFSTQRRVGELARSIVGPGAAFFCYQLVYKYARNADAFPWHQDDSYSQSSRGYYSIWLAVSDATIANGCLWALPGRSLDAVAPFTRSELGNTCWPLDHPDQGVPIELPRGSAVIFSSRLIHKSGGNTTDQTRKGHIIAFIEEGSTIQGKPWPFVKFRAE